MPPDRITCLLLALGLITAETLPAQQPDSVRKDTMAVRLPAIEVLGTIIPVAGPTIGSGVPARVATLTRADLKALRPRMLTDALASLPGMSSYDDLGSPRKINLSTRGFFASPVVGLPQGISVFLDGVRQNEPDAAQVNFDLLPMAHVSRVEILSGTSSLLGRNSLGGAINLVTRRGDGPAHGELAISGGSFGARGAEGSISGRSPGGLGFYLGGGYDREDGWRQATAGHADNAFMNLGRLDERRGISLQAFYSRSRAETAGSLPESIFLVKPDSNLSADDYEDLDQFQIAGAGYAPLGSGRASASVYYRRHTAERFNANQRDDPDASGHSDNHSFGGTVDYRLATSLGAGTLGLRFGADASWGRTAVELFADSTKFPGGTLVQTTSVESPLWDLGGFALADWRIGRMTFSGGARFDYVRIPFQNLLDPGRDTTSSYPQLSPRAGVSVEAGRGLSLYASIGRSFRAPAVIELACADPEEPCPLPFALGDDPPIDPVTATTVEIGGQWVAGVATLSVSAYRTSVSNDIFLFPFETSDPVGSTIDGFFGNIKNTRREGIELGSRFLFASGQSAYLNYAYTRATFQTTAEIFSIREDDALGIVNVAEPGDRLPLVPDHQVKFGGQFFLPADFRVAVDGRFIGEQYLRGDEANDTAPLEGYFVGDARLVWEHGPWEIAGIVTNVLDGNAAVFGTFNINQGGGSVLERFLTPAHRRAFRIIIRRAFGVSGSSDS